MEQAAETYPAILREIDELQEAIINFSKFPHATRALLASLEERYNAGEVAMREFAETKNERS